MDILLSLVAVSFAAGCFAGQIIRKFFENNQRSCRIEVKYIGVFLDMKLVILLITPRILTAECCLHIQCWRFDVGEHQHSRPFRNGNTRGQLSDRQRNCLFMVIDGITYFVKCLLCFLIFSELSVTSSKNDLILTKNRVCFELLCQSLCTVNTI